MKTPWSASIDDLAKTGTRFVTHRAARRAVVLSAFAAGAVALAGGFAIGRAAAPAPVPVAASTAAPQQRHYVLHELGRLNASLAQLDPRIDRLAGQLAELRTFDERLRARTSRSGAAAGTADADSDDDGADDARAQGGPALPAKHCASAQSAQRDARAARAELDCMSATLSSIEQAVASHEAALSAFPSRWPVGGPGRVVSRYGNRVDPFSRRLAFHSGVDVAAPTGTPILASAGGRVAYAGTKSGYGNVVDIDHGNGFVTRYGHASKIDVHVGQIVLPREHIADVGSSGRSTGPHLHYEVIVDGTTVDPAGYMTLLGGQRHG